MDTLKTSSDTLFILLGAVMVLAMHAGFAFLELGTVRRKNQVNALVKIMVDFAVSTIAYFFIGYSVAYGVNFFTGAETLAQKSGYELVRFFFLLTFAAAIPAIVSGGIAERARFNPQLAATFLLVGFVYPFFEGIAWNQHFGVQAWLKGAFGEEFHDFAGTVVVHAVGGWIGLVAVLLLGARRGRYSKEGGISAHPPSSIPFLALGAWMLSVGWFGFNVMSAQTIDKISGLVAVNSLLAMAGGTLAALVAGQERPGLRPQRAARRAGGDLRGLGRHASAGRARHRRGRRGVVRLDVHAHAEPLEDRRRARRLAAARAVRSVGRTRGGHLRHEGAGRPRRRHVRIPARRHRDRHRGRGGRRRDRLRAAEGDGRACGSIPRRSSTAPTSRSTGSARRRNAKRPGEDAAPAAAGRCRADVAMSAPAARAARRARASSRA